MLNKEEVMAKLMEFGLHETQALECFVSRNKHDMEVVLNFLFHYGNYINYKK